MVQLPYMQNGDGSGAATLFPASPGSGLLKAAPTPSGSLPLELTFLSSMEDFGTTIDGVPSNKSGSGGEFAPSPTDPIPLTLPVLSVTVDTSTETPLLAIAQPLISKGNILQRYEEG